MSKLQCCQRIDSGSSIPLFKYYDMTLSMKAADLASWLNRLSPPLWPQGASSVEGILLVMISAHRADIVDASAEASYDFLQPL